MRTITLELLRHGPAHNQLLSPLTPYLALCENHGAVTLHVPFEHNQFLFRLSALDYKHNEEARTFQLKDTAKVLGDILALIPGLTAESNKEESTKEQLTHLRLILSASELALLPFEMALSPNGLPGAGQHLLLQPQLPICLTREIRRVGGEQMTWPDKFKILFVAASPPGVGSIPLESHLLTLRRVIDPWMKHFDQDDPGKRQQEVEKHFVFLPEASVEAIEEQCASGGFTHVHILAHGVEKKDNFDTRFYLALHKAQAPYETDYISGPRLAAALRPSNSHQGLARPVVVTLASCNSGGVGSVAGAGASIAHALHESGIPVVVAGQFPLSFKGSVRLVECLYEGLLWGKDPRWLLYDLRRRLFSQFPDTHDWASLTAYVSLPSEFDKQLCEIQIKQASTSIDAAMNHADEVTRQHRMPSLLTAPEGSPKVKTTAEKGSLFENANKKIKNAKQKLAKLLDKYPAQSGRIHGMLASTDKRQAEIVFMAQGEAGKEESVKLLRSAQDHYWQAFQKDKSTSWALVQYLSLALVQQNLIGKTPPANGAPMPRPEKNLEAIWILARMLSQYDLHGQDRQRAAWAHGNLIELYLLTLILDLSSELPGVPDQAEAERCALDHTYALIEIVGQDAFELYATRRQIFRYKEWFPEIANLPAIQKLADQIYHAFPEKVEEMWR